MMNNISINSTKASEQLGLYDFFNVLLSGTVFVLGMCAINKKFFSVFSKDFSFIKSLALFIIIYLTGLIIQEIAAYFDEKFFQVYRKMNRSILKGSRDSDYKQESSNNIIKNPFILEQYRNRAFTHLRKFSLKNNSECFENDYVNGYIFSTAQYYVSIKGQDGKTEKMRALSSMSRDLTVCFGLLSFNSFISLFINNLSSVNVLSILNICSNDCECILNKLIIMLVFLLLSIIFKFRWKRTIRKFLLILLGTYNAILGSEEIEIKKHTEV